VIDLLHSALGSIAANGLACLLLTFGAHHHAQVHAAATGNETEALQGAKENCAITPSSPTRRKVKGNANSNKAINEHAAQFAVEMLRPVNAGSAALVDVHSEYKRWCDAKGVKALPPPQIGSALRTLFESAGLPVGVCDGRIVVRGVGLQENDSSVPVKA
jgi:type IV secretory pathway TrbL component